MKSNMGQAASLTVPDKLIMRCLHDELFRPMDGADVSTPRGESAKQEVRRLRGLLEQRVLGEEAEAELKAQFDHFDKDGSGEIDQKELGRLIRVIGLRRSEKQLAAMVSSVDDDGSGEISWPEFCQLLNVEMQGPKVIEDIEIAWDEPYGTIMYTEGSPGNETGAGANGDGIAVDSCTAARFYYKEGDIDDLVELAEARLAEERKWLSEEQKVLFKTQFDRFDEDKSGTMDIDELSTLVTELKLDCTKVDLMEAVPDTDKEEYSFREFCQMLVRVLKHHSDGEGMMSCLDGSKEAAASEAAARERDSGALVMWGC